MPESKTIQTFSFGELDDSAKDKVRYWLAESFDPDWITDYLREELKMRGLDGLTNDGPYWGLYVQGSGVAFQGTIDLSEIKPIEGDGQESDEKHVAAITAAMKKVAPENLNVTVTYSGRSPHSRSYDVEVGEYWEGEHEELSDDEIEGLQDAILDWLRDLSDYLYRLAESDYEHQSSDEYIAETCEANEYLFDVTGDPVHHLIGPDLCDHGIARPWYCRKCAADKKIENATG